MSHVSGSFPSGTARYSLLLHTFLVTQVLGAPPRSILVWGRGRRRRRHGPSHLKTKAPPWGWSLSAFGFHPGLKGDVQVKGT
ncbi:hypothetical protein CPAR01_10448 [Colletotrichum paranaense]|uniref:Uncharacterized protein n=3 Tax=Colletotrichum acutatum species complex TaxID=2707335 RepID=A0AAI9ZBJ9_9PEZI|nr:uncharacterized protein CCOS01_01517 [Colletotrichum costaricense]XP_060346891.1 uncharacterized protein CPAR01_10448 [Colletotrichum paranaense]KAK1446144.1 hypothetical protein CMEL01_10387 [Colletotrichum melonis]KAK1533740.1 hypothetical protein CPAR01_10448 [Colletotrichum paranaense]KAK1540203.1 hypothetical protein CCOS01_01517 [Colletotrichum costaricense]